MKQHFPAILLALLFITGCTDRSNVSEQESTTTAATTISSFRDDENIEEHTASTSSEITEPTQGISSEPTQEPEPDIISTEPPAPETTPAETTSTTSTTIEIAAEPPFEYQDLIVHFIDVGQGDSTFIELPNGETMLIDAGEREYGDRVVAYIYNQGYDTLDYVVATHPHTDHIGGIVDVLNAFPTKNFYMTSYVNPTQTFDDMLTAVENNGAAAHEVMAGAVIVSEPELLVEVVAPKALADDSNNNSVVIKLTYGENKFLFTGDAEKDEEDGIWTNIKCDVLKVGHHGSDTSSTKNFLKKVEPTYSVISCGLYNSYGHPDEAVLKRLYDRNINVYRKLNVAYDDFYKKFGLIHSQTNKRYFAEDVSYNLVAGLEKSYDKTKLLEKSDIFTKRTIVPPKAVERVDTALEALTLSIAEKARVDFEYMSSLTGMTEDELKHDLTGEIFKIPHTENEYQTASEYLSGDIRKKLREAEEIAEYDPDFNINVSALKQAMPELLKAGDIDIKLGAAWIDPKYYEQFMYELLQTPAYQRSDSPSARWNKSAIVGVEYSVHANSFHVSNKSADRSVLATQKYGTHKMNAYDIFEHLLNLQEPKVYKTIEVPDGLGDTKEKRVVDIDATRVVQRKADDIRKAFKAWIFKDPQRREAIVERYNELFNSIRPREFDGSALSFPMMTADIHLHDHQKNAIAHAMFGGNTLFAHCVGAGKTFEMIATAMESKRLGLCTKSLFAVPNHLTEQIGDDFQKLYPGANILVATKKDFKKENRQQLFAKIATGNYDAIIIGHSQLGKIPVSKERQVMTIQSQIDDILQGIEELKKSEGSKFQIKAMERTRKSLQKQLDKLEKAGQDDTLTFEQLGIDRLFVDEAHEFKNLFVATKLQNVAGISNSASQKALDLFLKCRYLDEKTGGKGVIFATGTPVFTPYQHSNTEFNINTRFIGNRHNLNHR